MLIKCAKKINSMLQIKENLKKIGILNINSKIKRITNIKLNLTFKQNK